MNRSIKTLILTAGVAVATLTVSVPAHAGGFPNGPGGLQQGPIVDPQPQPEPTPVPAGPGDIANPPHCTHGCGGDQGPQGPKDIGPAPTEDVINGGPLDAADPTDDPAHNAPLDQGCSTGCDLPEKQATSEPPPEVTPVVLDSDKPSAADQLDRAEVLAPATTEDGGINPLLFLFAGTGAGALILAAAARRRRQQQTAGSTAA